MSVQPIHSPQLNNSSRASINYNQITTNNNNNNNNQMQQQHQQTPQKLPPQSEATAPASIYSQDNYHYATPSRLQQQYDLRSLTGQQQHRAQYAQMAPRRGCSGVDKLILAAMIDDAQATPQHAAGINSTDPWSGGHSIPSGRGIGYFAGQRDNNYAQIPTPSNRSEFELYRLLERANLLNYFGTFLNFGGDDVQQLCDADEEEFLEIMSLVGMTQKPLHVRRLQKALIEWRESRDLEISMLRSSHLNYLMTNQPANVSAAQPPSSVPTGCDQAQSVTGPTSVPPVSLYLSKSQSIRPQAKAPAESNHYIPPRDLLIGAPKRIRLLDSLNNRQCAEPNRARAIAGPNSSPFKKRFGSALSSSPKRRTDDRSDEDGSEEDGNIEVIDSSDAESECDENDVPKPEKLTRAAERGSPIEVARPIQSTEDNDDHHGHRRAAAPSKRSHSELADPAGQRANNDES